MMAESELARAKKGEIQGYKLTISELASEGHGIAFLDQFLHREFANFDELREAVEEGGYTMRMPNRDDTFDINKASAHIFKDGKEAGVFSFTANTDLTKGPIVNIQRPKLNDVNDNI
jgi:hypothetical protein